KLLKRSGRVESDQVSLTAGEVSIDRETREVISCGEKTELTLKEFELLNYLMEHMNRVVTRDELLDHIWGYDYDGETRTLDMHIKTLRQKLKDGGQQIKTVRGVGYRFLKERSDS
ncbi:MAG: winged helix-turn-helix domain-containing protein, partial [Clostridium sp.]